MKLLTVKHTPDAFKKKYMATFLVDGKEKTVLFGQKGYNDFITYSKTDKDLAEQKRKAYIARHRPNEDWSNPLSPGTLSRFILWEHPSLLTAIRQYKHRFSL